MPRLPRVRTRVLTTIETKARLRAEAKFKLSNLGLQEALIKMLERVDPLELVATLGGAFVIYDLFHNTPEFIEGWIEMSANIVGLMPIIGFLKPIIEIILKGVELTNEQWKTYNELKDTPDYYLFLKAFALSYILMKNSGSIMNIAGGISGFAASSMGYMVVP